MPAKINNLALYHQSFTLSISSGNNFCIYQIMLEL